MRNYSYLATPYAHNDEKIREKRVDCVTKVAADLIQGGLVVFSPITHNHPIAKFIGRSWDDTWEEVDYTFLSKSSELIVLMVDGWKESTGVSAEIIFAKSSDIPIRYLNVSESIKNGCNYSLKFEL